MFHLRAAGDAARVVVRRGAALASRVQRRAFGAKGTPQKVPDTRPPAPWGAKPGFKAWQPVPLENPSIDVYQFWAYKLVEGFFVGGAVGFLTMVPYWIWAEYRIKDWHERTEAYFEDLQKNRVEPLRKALEKRYQSPWWYEMTGSDNVDLNEMIRFLRTTQAENDTEAFEVLSALKPWDGTTEGRYREAMVEWSEYPNYYKMGPEKKDDDDEGGDDDDEDDE